MTRRGPDRRVQKTRKLLQDALVELVASKGFEKVTIQDILDRANVGRSTFYTHFQDKHELLHSCFEEVQKLLEQHARSSSEFTRHSPDIEINDFTLSFFKFSERNYRLIKALLKQPDLAEYFSDSVIHYLNEPIKRHLAREKINTIPSEIICHYFVSAFFGVLKWWVSNDMPCTAEEIDSYFKQLSLPTIKNIVPES
jgi:AcrR family transcriptional regulator